MNAPVKKATPTQMRVDASQEAAQKNAESGVSRATVTVVTSDSPAILTKRIFLKDGVLRKEGGGVLVSGHAKVFPVHDLAEFAGLLKTLGPAQALIYGRADADDIALVTKRNWEALGKPDDVIPRTNETFSWPNGPGILMIDYDPPDGETPMTPEELISALRDAVPALAQVEMLSWPSASSWIKNQHTGGWAQEQSGQRLYIMVEDARDIPRAGKILFERLWLSGHGYMKVSSAGCLLSRALVDATVWQPSRLDFAAGAQCEEPLVQDRGEPALVDGNMKWLDTIQALTDLAPREQKAVDALKAQARAEKKDKAAAARDAWLDRQAIKMVGDDAGEEEVAAARDQAAVALDGGPLSGNFVIEVETDRGIEAVTVAAILSATDLYDRAKTRDPVEPEYDGGRLVGMLFLDGPTKSLRSFARGEATYQLAETSKNIQVIAGELTQAVDETLRVLCEHPDVFDFGEELVLQEGGRLHVQTEHSLNHFLGSVIQYTKSDHKGKLSKIDPPSNIARQILALKSRRCLKPLSYGRWPLPPMRRDYLWPWQ